jgi:hypothetical protein
MKLLSRLIPALLTKMSTRSMPHAEDLRGVAYIGLIDVARSSPNPFDLLKDLLGRCLVSLVVNGHGRSLLGKG